MMKTNEFIIMKIILYYIKKTVTLVVVCGMVMHSMVIILKIKTRQKKVILFHWRCSAVFIFHFSVCSIAVPVANGVAKLACLLSCLPPEQYIVAVWQNRDVKNNKSILFNLRHTSAWIYDCKSSVIWLWCSVLFILIKRICRCGVMYCSGHPFPRTHLCSRPPPRPPRKHAGSDAFRAHVMDSRQMIGNAEFRLHPVLLDVEDHNSHHFKKDTNKLTDTSLLQK